jgi:hypothetical protein
MSLKIVYRIGLIIWGIFLITVGSFTAIGAMENKLMKVSFERSGGVTGIPVTMVVDVANLPLTEAEQLRQLVKAADFFNYPALIATEKSLPDRFQYQIAIEDDDKKHSITVGEAVIPDKLRPLIDFVMKVGRRK